MVLIKHLRARPELDAYLGRAVYGNLCCFSFNFEGRRNLRQRRSRAPQRMSPQASEFVRAMERDGFYRPPFVIPSSIMKTVVSAYRDSLEDSNRSTAVMSARARENGLDVFCRAVTAEKTPELDLLLTSEIKELVKAFFAGEPSILEPCARRTEFIPTKVAREYDIYSNFWHCDNEPSDRFKMFVALNDIGPNNGPLHLLSKVNTRKILRRGFKSRHDYGLSQEQIEDPKILTRFVGPAGSLIFTNVTQCLHRAGIPDFGHHRDIAEFQFRSPT